MWIATATLSPRNDRQNNKHSFVFVACHKFSFAKFSQWRVKAFFVARRASELCHFEPFVKRRPSDLQGITTAKNLKHCHFEWVKRAKNPYFKGVIYTSNLWILRYAQYDKSRALLACLADCSAFGRLCRATPLVILSFRRKRKIHTLKVQFAL